MPSGAVAAVDLGRSDGRVVVGHVGPTELRIDEVHRFRNEPVALPDGLHWDVVHLYREAIEGLAIAARRGDAPVSIGVTGWAADVCLLDADGALAGVPVHPTAERLASGPDRVHDRARPASLYMRTGVPFRPTTTIYQLAALDGTDAAARARTILLLPDLIGYWLTGELAAEETISSTTGLFDPAARTWAWDLIETLGWDRQRHPAPRRPGALLGPILPAVSATTGLPPSTAVTNVGSHDHASAVAAVPAGGPRFAYVICDADAVVGVETAEPILTEASRTAGFANELGVDGRVRYQREAPGLALLRETLRAWERAGEPEELGRLIQLAAALPRGGPVIDATEAGLAVEGDVPARIEDACLRAGLRPPSSRPALIRCVLDSLAAGFARTVADASRLSGVSVSTVHAVGAIAANELLCQLAADACELPVVAGPVDATSIGNIVVQARSRGLVEGDLEQLRALVRATSDLRRYEPATSKSRRRGGARGLSSAGITGPA